jgi:hypothetical protein
LTASKGHLALSAKSPASSYQESWENWTVRAALPR